MKGLVTHLNAHLAGASVGRPPVEWLTTSGYAVCTVCQKLAKVSCNGGIHPRCWPHARSLVPDPPADAAQPPTDEQELPSLDSICNRNVPGCHFLNCALIPQARSEYVRLCAAVVRNNDPRAWDHMGDPLDTAAAKVCRKAYLEWSMFPKAVLCAPKRRGKGREVQTLSWTKSRLDRWSEGERVELWLDAPEAKPSSSTETASTEVLQKQAAALAAEGRPAQAYQRLTGPGMKKKSREVVKKLESKFPRRDHGYVERQLPPPPPPVDVDAEDFAKAIMSFNRGAGGGPKGLRPRFLQEIIREDGQHECREVLAI